MLVGRGLDLVGERDNVRSAYDCLVGHLDRDAHSCEHSGGGLWGGVGWWHAKHAVFFGAVGGYTQRVPVERLAACEGGGPVGELEAVAHKHELGVVLLVG